MSAVAQNIFRFDPRAFIKGDDYDQSLCLACGRDSCEDETHVPPEHDGEPQESPTGKRAAVGFEPAPDFLRRLESQPEPKWMVRELIPDEGSIVFHGRPRTMKSLNALEVSIALATGTPAFGIDRFAVAEPQAVLHFGEEDGARMTASRVRLFLRGRGLDEAPERLHFLSRPGWNLEDARDQDAMLEAVARVPDARMLVIDPVRASLPSIDKGPADAAGGVRFLRTLLRETSVRALLLPHHDTKPSRDQKDDRLRAERASGGAVFSIADCPINFERVDDRTCYAVPCAYKVSGDPAPFRVVFETGSPAGEPFRDFLRARATTQAEGAEAGTRTDAAVMEVLRLADDWLGTAAIAETVRGRKADTLSALRRLSAGGFIVFREVPGRVRGNPAKEYRHGGVS